MTPRFLRSRRRIGFTLLASTLAGCVCLVVACASSDERPPVSESGSSSSSGSTSSGGAVPRDAATGGQDANPPLADAGFGIAITVDGGTTYQHAIQASATLDTASAGFVVKAREDVNGTRRVTLLLGRQGDAGAVTPGTIPCSTGATRIIYNVPSSTEYVSSKPPCEITIDNVPAIGSRMTGKFSGRLVDGLDKVAPIDVTGKFDVVRTF